MDTPLVPLVDTTESTLSPSVIVGVAACSLHQWALDFDGNYERVVTSILKSKQQGAKLRVGCELELCGHDCEDHFLESDTFLHCWEILNKLLQADVTEGILCDIGMPIVHRNTSYNCRVFVANRMILLIRPKVCLSNAGNAQESRYFSPWLKGFMLEDYPLPALLQSTTGQTTVQFGLAGINCLGVTVGTLLTEEFSVLGFPRVAAMGLENIDIICNSSGSHFELRKMSSRVDLLRNTTKDAGTIHVYSNLQGCDGRLYYDGGAMVALNGDIVKQGPQFSLNEVEVIVAMVELARVRPLMNCSSPGFTQPNATALFPLVTLNISLRADFPWYQCIVDKPIIPQVYDVPEEIFLGASSWLWDYLRRSKASGYFVPLSGGSDSSSVAALVGSMCGRVCNEIDAGNTEVLSDLESVLRKSRDDATFPKSSKALCHELLYTCYMGTVNSSSTTRSLAQALSETVGARHHFTAVDTIVQSFLTLFSSLTGKFPRFKKNGGSTAEDLALQNIQSRIRMVLSYLFAGLLPWVYGRQGWLLVLGTGNVDECLRGYMTKYDCSSGDINPIGSLSKIDLRKFLLWASEDKNLGYSILKDVVTTPPTAELRPIENLEGNTALHSQTDEDEMGMTYEELGIFGKLRKISRCGPVSMFSVLAREWAHLGVAEVARKVKHFFTMYSINRHKLTTVTPGLHASPYSPDDNRFDLRPFLYPNPLSWQFSIIDKLVSEGKREAVSRATDPKGS